MCPKKLLHLQPKARFRNKYAMNLCFGTVVGQELRRKYRELGRSPSWAVHAKMHWKPAARAAKICAERAKSIE